MSWSVDFHPKFKTEVEGCRRRCRIVWPPPLRHFGSSDHPWAGPTQLWGLQQLLDGWRQGPRVGGGRKATHHLPLAVDEELGEVPPDGSRPESSKDSGPGLLQEAIEGVGIVAIDIDFCENGKVMR